MSNLGGINIVAADVLKWLHTHKKTKKKLQDKGIAY